MTEHSLDKIFRLTGVRVGNEVGLAGGTTSAYMRTSSRGRPVHVHSYPTPQQVAGGQLQLSSAYRSAWGNVNVGDVLEFGQELWKVIPASSFPGAKPSTSSGSKTSKGTGSSTGGSTTGVKSGASTSSGTGAATGGSSSGTSGSATGAPGAPGSSAAGTAANATVRTYRNYLQDIKNPKIYDELTLPDSYVVTIVPVTPALYQACPKECGMTINRGFWSTLFMLAAFVFFVLLALTESTVLTITDDWFLGAGLSSMVLSFLLGGGWANWNAPHV